MNQILNTESVNNRNNYSEPKNKIKGTGLATSTDKIIRIFAICMIIFAVALISTGVYSFKKNQDYNQEAQAEEIPTANIMAEEAEGKVQIVVSHEKNINQLIYSWNGQKENKVQGDGNKLEKIIDLPAGNNNLLITVIDEDGVESTFSKTFESESGVDIINPEISLEVKDAKVIITANDETGLDFITYRWNDDEEKKITPNEDSKEIKEELEIKRGTNDLTVIAVDSNNNTTTKTQSFKGLTNPEIIIEVSADRSSLDITCKHEVGIKKVVYTLNGQEYAGEWDDSPTEVQFTQPLDVGYNRIILTATSVEDTEYTFDGDTDYYPEGYDASQANNNTEE